MSKENLVQFIEKVPYKSFVVDLEWPYVTKSLFWVASMRLIGRANPHGGILASILSERYMYSQDLLERAVQVSSTCDNKRNAKEWAVAILEGRLT